MAVPDKRKTDTDPNEWTKIPQGLCEKLTNGSLVAGEEFEP
jgi:hypothetical protein